MCLCEFLTYIAFFKSTLKTQSSKNNQMHKAISFTTLTVLFIKVLVGGLCFIFLLNEKSKTVRGTGPELFSQLHSDFWKIELWGQTLPSFPISKGMQVSLYECLIHGLFSLSKYHICYQNKLLLIHWLRCHSKGIVDYFSCLWYWFNEINSLLKFYISLFCNVHDTKDGRSLDCGNLTQC